MGRNKLSDPLDKLMISGKDFMLVPIKEWHAILKALEQNADFIEYIDKRLIELEQQLKHK